MEKNYYKILEIRGHASEAEIKKAYRNLSKKYHPDTNAENKQALEKFQDISEAYSILGNAEKRKVYDEQLKPNRQEAKQGTQKRNTQERTDSRTFSYHDMSEQFEQFFGIRPEQEKKERNPSVKKREASTNPVDASDLFYKYMGFKK